ncbi:hypothetical protein TPHA_0G00310 [Tetrapisispora phaffii CBS 4417]|uniref:PWWP domain-containing protein n=1 Tax=Tetrapisispora phaffii (strain ATCC 24235 / CBS 4417 / NBRC 1672 / NRRL Y-8282 / UCD 70-5) TaxID=1071381 RepID=G8BVE1_TETPH|nr:hypothetical protein TPHA_0G00310 [Tetrapisispora phaffii CBS 4417]CCE63869.1 hypothetical protein TPHA_0G00310 [Tetrapisispora phaffii CBS 4417]
MTNNSDLKTGDLVLCKVGSFPPWPAVVFPQRYLRNDVYKKRKAARVAVCFFNDPTYYWEQPQKLKRLTSEVIHDYFKEKKTNASLPDLIAAYKEAKNFTNLNDFITAKFSEEGRLDELLEESIPQGEDPFLSKGHQRSKKNNGKQGDSTDGTFDYSNNSTSTNESSRKKRKLKSDESSENEKNLDTQVSSSEKNTNAIETTKNKNSTKKKRAKLDSSRNIEICMLFRRKIQKNLIQRDTAPSNQELEETHNLLTKIEENLYNNPNFFDINALRQSKLHKLLKVIVNDSNLSEFHEVSKRILLSWTNTIHQLKLEKIAEHKEIQEI